LFLSSTGCRVGVIPELKLGHITNLENCKQVLCYADSNEEYTTFMTPEASQVFDDYLAERQQDREKLTAESPAFRSQYILGDTPATTMETGTIRNALAITTKDVKRIKKGNRYNKQTLHALRKFFNVTLKSRHDCNLSLSEKLMGHSTSIPLDNHYGSFSDESLFEEYKKAIPALSISKEYKLQEQIKKNEEESKSSSDKLTDEIHSLRRDNLEMKERFANLEKGVDELLKQKKKT
jgi:integrase